MFIKTVELFRLLGRPKTDGNRLNFEGKVDPSVIALAREIEQLPNYFGSFDHLLIDGEKIELEMQLPASEMGRFHQNVDDFIASTPTLNFGVIPSEYYICDLDFYSGEPATDPKLLKLYHLSRFIRAVSLLSVNGYVEPGLHENRLIFVVAADGKSPSKTLAVSIHISPTLLDFALPQIRLLEALISPSRKNEVHVEERLSIMRLSIADSLASTEEGDRFSVLVKNWPEVLDKYHHNFLAFIHQFSFEKVRKEIATAEVENATKMSAVLGDITGKLLALPVSLVAIALLRKAETNEQFWLGFAGLACVTIVFLGLLVNQWLQVVRLRGSFLVIFEQYDATKFPPKLSRPILAARRNAGIQYQVLRISFVVFLILAILPIAGAMFMAIDRDAMDLIKSCIRIANFVH